MNYLFIMCCAFFAFGSQKLSAQTLGTIAEKAAQEAREAAEEAEARTRVNIPATGREALVGDNTQSLLSELQAGRTGKGGSKIPPPPVPAEPVSGRESVLAGTREEAGVSRQPQNKPATFEEKKRQILEQADREKAARMEKHRATQNRLIEHESQKSMPAMNRARSGTISEPGRARSGAVVTENRPRSQSIIKR